MLLASGIAKRYGAHVVLDGVSLSVGPGSRIGVVGPNGIGKSTLLRVLAGLEEPDGGTVERSPRSLNVGYLPQEPDAQPGESLFRYLARRTGVGAAEAELDRLEAALAQDSSLVDAHAEALERFLSLGGADLRARAASECEALGLPADRLDVEVGALSGGQAARAALAAIVLSRFDVFLLDEPTNNLDFQGLDTLEVFLSGVRGGVVVISHDRAFLDRSVDRIIEIEEESHRAVEYAGGWSAYVEARELARTHRYTEFSHYRTEKARLEERLRAQRAWAEQGAKAERRKPRDSDKAQRDFRINRTEKQASKVRITEKALARMPAVEKPWEGWQLHLELAPESRSGDVVARLDQAVVERGTFRLGPIDLDVGWQDRVALLGPNGSGKTTLLHALLGRIPLVSGSRYLGPGVVVGELDQARALFSRPAPVLEVFMAETRLLAEEARSLLAKFGLGPGHVSRQAERLSPGERTRAVLASLMARGVNCLVLDEPTNHLDLPAIEQLEQALETYAGTLLLVTHDRWLLDSVRLTHTVEVGDQLPSTRS